MKWDMMIAKDIRNIIVNTIVVCNDEVMLLQKTVVICDTNSAEFDVCTLEQPELPWNFFKGVQKIRTRRNIKLAHNRPT